MTERRTTNHGRRSAVIVGHVPAPQRLIVALDVPDLAAARTLVRTLRPVVTWFKVGSELFTAGGPAAVAVVHDQGGRVFLDLKFHDIPHTVAGAVSAAARLGVAMMNVHVAGGEAMLRAAVEANGGASERTRPILIGVTALTSDESSAASLEQVVDAAVLAKRCGLDGVVASAQEVQAIRLACGSSFVIVTPGIRPTAVPGDDQRRTATPGSAVRAGADYLVVGRPITQASDPLGVARAVLLEIEASS